MLCGSIGFRDYVFDTGGLSVLQKLLAAIQRKHQHGRIRSQPGNLACGLKPVHDRHLQVQYHDVGVQFFDAFNRYLAVVCLATNYPMGVLLDTRAKRTAYRGVVVDDENGIWHFGSRCPWQVADRATSYRSTDGYEEGRLHPTLQSAHVNTVNTVRWRTLFRPTAHTAMCRTALSCANLRQMRLYSRKRHHEHWLEVGLS